ncbi:hypothetical protein HMPREF0634_1377 [Peptostreptococcus stomatis DSM 17678]|uniref:Uncharacterized protein n=1 Tax=Peptostreptococcus stomatis DSM 17678 TaxID=596315 RepID=E0E4K0_9FIRM|nr:hypothetical protein HMPREF0634_1377 [Peptostreptococcus stomatis DSM 17678]
MRQIYLFEYLIPTLKGKENDRIYNYKYTSYTDFTKKVFQKANIIVDKSAVNKSAK